MKKIVIAGGTGFIGSLLTNHFIGRGNEVVVLSRRHHTDQTGINYVKWDGRTLGDWTNILEYADVLINLNGKSVNCRYTEANKQAIYDTRIEATNVLGQALKQCQHPPRLWINASSATIYEHAMDSPMTERSPITATDFSVDVCKKWEAAFHSHDLAGIRKVVLRIAIVLGKDGGAFPVIKRLAKLGLGGKQGNGRQMVSWIHEQDLTEVFSYCIENSEVTGTWNVSAPNPVKNKAFMKAIGRQMKVPVGLPAPQFLLKAGALVLGTEPELVLKSRYVIPEKLTSAGFRFRYEKISDALVDLC